MKEKAIAVLELRSLAKGIESADAMLKAANCFVIDARPVCPGKYLIVVGGDVGAVKSSIEAGLEVGTEYIVDSILIPSIAEEVFYAINACTEIDATKALAMVETFSLAGAILAADVMVKSASVQLIEVRLAKGLGGKAFVTATGEVGDCKACLEAVTQEMKDKGMIIEQIVIPHPHEELEELLY